MHRYEDAIADCQAVMRLNPYHFGAASGMGLCFWSLKQTAPALAAFESALEIHPGLTVIKRHVETLKEEEAARREGLKSQGLKQQRDEGPPAAE